MQVVDDFRFADTPKPTSAHEDDPMYQAHVERLRTTAAFIKIFIYRHLFCMANTNLSRQPPRTDYRDEMVKWCRELLLSQRKMIQRGDYTDFGSVMSYQLSQTGRGLIPAIYITSRLIDPSQDANSSAILKEAQELLVLAYDLLRQLSNRFTASNRQLQIMQSAFRRLDLSLRKRHHNRRLSGAHDSSSHARAHGNGERGGTQGVAAPTSTHKEMTSGLDLIAGVAGAELLGAEGLGESTASNEEEDDFDDLDRDKKPGCKLTSINDRGCVARLRMLTFSYHNCYPFCIDRDLGFAHQSTGGENSSASGRRFCRMASCTWFRECLLMKSDLPHRHAHTKSVWHFAGFVLTPFSACSWKQSKRHTHGDVCGLCSCEA